MIRVSLKDSNVNVNLDYYIDESVENVSEKATQSDVLLLTCNNTGLSTESKKEKPNKSLFLSSETGDLSKSKFNNTKKFKLKDMEIYFYKRMLQIYVVIYSFLICYAFQLLFSLSKLTFLYSQFEITSFTTSPLTRGSAFYLFFNNCTIILPIFTNYIAFYFVVKDSYKPKKEIENALLDKEVVDLNVQDKHQNKDIESFLK